MAIDPQTRIVVRHQAGSKINQVEQIPLKDLTELVLGREQTCNIVYDQKRDDVVSRRHAAIRIDRTGDKLGFKLADLNSSNGTLLNGEKITGEVELAPDDTVELGRGGPTFTFDIEPRPANLAARTRVMSAADAKATRAISVAAANATGTAEVPKGTKELVSLATGTREVGGRASVGKETVMRMLFQERQKSGRVVGSSIAAVLAVLIVAGGGLYWHNRNVAAQLRTEARLAEDDLRKQRDEDRSRLGQTAKDIVNKYGNSSVMIDLQWRMYDRGTGKPLFHRVLPDPKSGQLVPVFVRLPNGQVVRWLTLDDQDRHNIGIQVQARGSGFVVSSNGMIMTNKHVAAGWMIPYSNIGESAATEGLIVPLNWDAKDKKQKVEVISLRSSTLQALKSWVPEDGGIVFEANRPQYIGGDTDNRRVFQGRNDMLEVRFPGSRVSMQASLVRASTDADAALVKVESGQALTAVEIAQDDKVEVGDRVVVLGYPGVSAESYVSVASIENGRFTNRSEIVPEPTVTEGIVSLVTAAFKREGSVTMAASFGEVYQMSINSTGGGNSGGPVLNAKGQVIGLFTYGRQTDASVTFAVPIKYGRALLNPQRGN